VSVLGLVLLFLFMEPLSMETSIYKIHEVSTGDRFLHGNLVALFGSLCSAVSFESSKPLLDRFSQNLIYFNIAFLGSFLFMLAAFFFDFSAPDSASSSLSAIFAPEYATPPNS
jgi:drug/metabolite transporter (DMT)-like permease